jgi:HPt (histidine-containing phosphotransfer) domain-containing protein
MEPMRTATMPATAPDIATFIYEAASHLARAREALRRDDVPALRRTAVALRDISDAAGAERMLELCAGLRAALAVDGAELEPLLDEIAEEFDTVTSELQTVRSA